MSKLKKIFTNVRILVLLVAVLIALILIHPSLSDGVAIRSVAKNSVAMDAGMASPAVNSKPMSREVIISINNNLILTEKDYHDAVAKIGPDETFTLKTNKNTYFITTRAPVVLDNSIITTSNDTSVNATVNTSVITTINTSVITPVITPVNTTVVNVNSTTIEDIGLTVYPRPKSNIKKGLDLEGGTRVLLQPMEEVTPADMDLVVSNIEQRLNVYGVSDVSVSVTKDLFGKSFISVEIPGANEQEVKNLLAEQGKFEAKVGNITVFKGGNKDILYVCRTATCSGITPGSCTTDANGATCRFRFSITLSGDAAKRQAAATQNLNIIHLGTGVDNAYLDKNISLYLDDELVDELMIGADLRGNPVTEISISGSGTGDGTKTATTDSLANMKKLQTVLVTGSLPVKLKIVKTESISPTLGSSFIKNATFAGLIALLCVVLLVAIRYREWLIAVPIVFALLAELVLTLGFASLIGWRIDIAAIAAIIIAVGTGVNDQIIITDETLNKAKHENKNDLESWKSRLKKALFIIFAAYFTILVAMLPLWFAGAGLLKGFALTTVIGISMGVFLARPAFGEFLEIVFEK